MKSSFWRCKFPEWKVCFTLFIEECNGCETWKKDTCTHGCISRWDRRHTCLSKYRATIYAHVAQIKKELLSSGCIENGIIHKGILVLFSSWNNLFLKLSFFEKKILITSMMNDILMKFSSNENESQKLQLLRDQWE